MNCRPWSDWTFKITRAFQYGLDTSPLIRKIFEFWTYSPLIQRRGHNTLATRVHMDIVCIRSSTENFLVVYLSNHPRISSPVKLINQYSYVPYMKTVDILKRWNRTDKDLQKICHEIFTECHAWAQSDPSQSLNVFFLMHLFNKFNENIQVEFTFVRIQQWKHYILRIDDTATWNSECVTVSTRFIYVVTPTMKVC